MNKTKPVVFQGLQLDAPDWVHYITQDKHGTIKMWEKEPKLNGKEWVGFGHYDIVCQASAPALLVAV